MCRPLSDEAYRLQPIEDVSPPWWNLGHTSWFFARNVLQPFGGEWNETDRDLEYVLNSYYVSLGTRIRRDRRGLVTRPTTKEIYHYRESVDDRIERLLQQVASSRWAKFESVMRIGLNHEQQHQELFYTEIKFILFCDPPRLRQPYRKCDNRLVASAPAAQEWIDIPGGLHEFGHREEGWCWDNELPVHRFFLNDFALAKRLVTCREYLEFIEDGGYQRPLVWLDNGWKAVEQESWQSPLYWENLDGEWHIWTLDGLRPLCPDEPICHVSFYEADAFARWKSENDSACRGARLPTEREWEHAARHVAGTTRANFLDTGALHPRPAADETGLAQMRGDAWEWTSSYYEAYPGYRPFAGALAEYNGKFMDNQRVLRGGSCVSERDHIRTSYRNFWSPTTRFQFTGLRLAIDR